MEQDSSIQLALLLATAIMAVTEYLKKPLVNTPFIVTWMLKHKLAYVDVSNQQNMSMRACAIQSRVHIYYGQHIVMWWLPYITFVLGIVCALTFNVDVITPIVPGVPLLPARLVTACIIGGGSNIIHDIVGGIKK